MSLDNKYIISILICLSIIAIVFTLFNNISDIYNIKSLLNTMITKTVLIFLPIILFFIFMQIYSLFNFRVFAENSFNENNLKIITNYDTNNFYNSNNLKQYNNDKKDIIINSNLLFNDYKSVFDDYEQISYSNEDIVAYEYLNTKYKFSDYDLISIKHSSDFVKILINIYLLITRFINYFIIFAFCLLSAKIIFEFVKIFLHNKNINIKLLSKLNYNNIGFNVLRNFIIVLIPIICLLLYYTNLNIIINHIVFFYISDRNYFNYVVLNSSHIIVYFIILFIAVYESIFYRLYSDNNDFYCKLIDRFYKTLIKLRNFDWI